MFSAQSLTEQNGLAKPEAVKVLNEIMKKCVLPRYIAMELTNQYAKPDSANYCLVIRGPFDSSNWNCLKGIIKKHNLNMKEMDNDMIIYRDT